MYPLRVGDEAIQKVHSLSLKTEYSPNWPALKEKRFPSSSLLNTSRKVFGKKRGEKKRTRKGTGGNLGQGRPVKAKESVGWLVDYAGTLEDALKVTWKIVTDGDHGLEMRKVDEGALKNVPKEISGLAPGDAATEAARKAILQNVLSSCGATISEALDIQAKHSAGFMSGTYCQKGSIGAEYTKTMKI